MVKKNCQKYKYGFSLLESLVVMIIVAIFVAVMASVIPHKSKPKVSAEAHGGFECYYDGNDVYSRAIIIGTENSTAKKETGNYCIFRPDIYVSHIIVNAVGGGSAGNVSSGGGAGQYISAYFPVSNTSYKLYPGQGGTLSHPDGYNSTVKMTKVGGSDEILAEAAGGNNATNVLNTTTANILDVYQDGQLNSSIPGYGCSYAPRAWLDIDNMIHVTFCSTTNEIVEEKLYYSNNSLANYPNSLKRYKSILQSPAFNHPSKPLSGLQQGKVNVLEYYDVGVWVDSGEDPLEDDYCTFAKISGMNNAFCPSRYKIKILLDIPDIEDTGAVSSLTKYATLLNYSKLANMKPGNGGQKGSTASSNGHAGAILISW